jgi:hypothetical protein
MTPKRPQVPLARVAEQQRRLAEMRAGRHGTSSVPNAKRLPGHGARSQKGR